MVFAVNNEKMNTVLPKVKEREHLKTIRDWGDSSVGKERSIQA